MATDLELALQAGGTIKEQTDLEKALASGGTVSEQPSGDITAPGAFATKGISEVLGAPADIVAAGLSLIPGVDIKDPRGGVKSIERTLGVVGGTEPIEREAETTIERVSETLGQVAGSIIPITKATQLLSRGTGLVSKVSKDIVQSMARSPKLATATEVASGVGAGLGRSVAEETAPDQPLVRTVAEITGAVVGGLTPVGITQIPSIRLVRKIPELVKRASLPFTKRGAKFRAGEFLKKQVVDPEQAGVKAVEETIGELPPVVATGEKKLIQLYNQLRDADPVTDANAIKNINRSIYKLEQELRSAGYGAPEVLKDITNKRVASIELRTQKRIVDAMDNAQRKLDKLPVAERASRESIIVRNELEKARNLDNANVKEAWNDVPKQFLSKFDRTTRKISDLKAELSVAEQIDIPTAIKNPNSFVNDPSKNSTTIKEMQGLRSKLLEVQRNARRTGQLNKARIAGEVSDSLLDDMTSAAGDASSVASSKLTTAIAATRKFKEKYQQGVVGDILGVGKSNIPRVDPSLTLDVSIGRAGAKGAIDINKVAVTPEAQNATKRFLAKSFTDFSTGKGTRPFNAIQARKWIANNEDILDQFPELRTQLNDINQSQQLASETLASGQARLKRIQDPKISTSARFLQSDTGKEIDTVFKKSNPTQSTRELVRQAQKDQTGEALEGLRGAYVDHVIKKSSIGAFNEAGEQTLSGKTLLGFMNNNRSALREVFSQKELVRMERIGKDLAKLETAESIKGTLKAEIDDMPSNFLRIASRIIGAKIGAKTGGTIQSASIVSERFKVFANKLTQDRAQQLIHDAITLDDGGKLLQSLLRPISKPTVTHTKNLKELNTQINAWLLGTGRRVLDDIEQETIEDKGEPNE